MKKAVLLSTEENLLQTMNEDLLDRNKDLKNFCRLLQHQQGMSSIAIDGRWGSGKTFFVKQCALLLSSTNSLSYLNQEMKEKVYDSINDKDFIENLADNKFLAVYYDAWKNDTEEDPVLSLIYEIIQQLDLKGGLIDLDNLSSVLTSALSVVTGRDVTDFFNKVKDVNLLNNIQEEKKMDAILQKFFVEALNQKCERLVIFVDELDRCRPSFAIKVLERIEHYFVNDRITFVFSMNIEQLQHTIKAFYGNDFDACRYLDRFFDIRLSLPTTISNRFFDSLNLNDNYSIDNVIMRIQDTYNLSLREFCKFYNTVKVAGVNYDRDETDNFLFIYIVTLSLALKFTNISVHDEFIKGKNIQPLLDLYDNEFGAYIVQELLNKDEILPSIKFNNASNTKDSIPVIVEDKLRDLYNAIFVKEYMMLVYL
ncbi:KAP family P-loop NTPase fold protein [Holdemanella porci]|uniref:KAP family P-loop NTPase fold protein n=1 Tax=Holdemanella porci TaxID=2652276 RepID=UPI003F92337A